MKMIAKSIALAVPAALLSMQLQAAQPDENAELPEMGFFVTSRGVGDGANLGGLAGADAHCQALAEEAGSTIICCA